MAAQNYRHGQFLSQPLLSPRSRDASVPQPLLSPRRSIGTPRIVTAAVSGASPTVVDVDEHCRRPGPTVSRTVMTPRTLSTQFLGSPLSRTRALNTEFLGSPVARTRSLGSPSAGTRSLAVASYVASPSSSPRRLQDSFNEFGSAISALSDWTRSQALPIPPEAYKADSLQAEAAKLITSKSQTILQLKAELSNLRAAALTDAASAAAAAGNGRSDEIQQLRAEAALKNLVICEQQAELEALRISAQAETAAGITRGNDLEKLLAELNLQVDLQAELQAEVERLRAAAAEDDKAPVQAIAKDAPLQKRTSSSSQESFESSESESDAVPKGDSRYDVFRKQYEALSCASQPQDSKHQDGTSSLPASFMKGPQKRAPFPDDLSDIEDSESDKESSEDIAFVASVSIGRRGTAPAVLMVKPDAPVEKAGVVRVIYAIIYFYTFAGSMVVPSLPFIALNLGASTGGIAALSSGFAMAQAVGSICMGKFSDKVGRKVAIIVCLTSGTIAFINYGIATSFTHLLVARIFHGFFDVAIGICQAFISDLVAPEEKTTAFAMSAASFGAAISLGPGIGGALLLFYGFSAVARAAAAMQVLPMLFGCFMLPRHIADDEEEDSSSEPDDTNFKSAEEEKGLGKALRDEPNIILFFIMQFSRNLVMGIFYGMIVLFLKVKYDYSATNMGALFCAAGTSTVIFSVLGVKRCVEKFGESRTIVLGLGILFMSWLTVLSFQAACEPYILVISICCAGALIEPCVGSLVTMLTPVHLHGETLGILAALSACGMMAGPILGAIAYDYDIWMPFIICALLTVGNIAGAAFIHTRIDSRIQAMKNSAGQEVTDDERGNEDKARAAQCKNRRRSMWMESIPNAMIAMPVVMTSAATGSSLFGLGEPQKISRRHSLEPVAKFKRAEPAKNRRVTCV